MKYAFTMMILLQIQNFLLNQFFSIIHHFKKKIQHFQQMLQY